MTYNPGPEVCAGGLDREYTLEDRYNRTEGRVWLTGTQALVRLVLMQKRRDLQAGLQTEGFISGYRGSPLGGYDQALWQARNLLLASGIHFQPAVNEELAATAILGTQQVESSGESRVKGVFSLWYGKGPGLDRSGDAIRIGSAYGSSPNGGVLLVVGDDHGAVSSSMPFQSEQAFASWNVPVLHPANIADYLEFGLYGWALSRFSGTWVGFKAISETVESACSIELSPHSLHICNPDDFIAPPGGLHYRWPDMPGPGLEERQFAKKEAVLAFARANPALNQYLGNQDQAVFGIIATGKAFTDLKESLMRLGLGMVDLQQRGIRILYPGLTWPLEPESIRRFAHGLREILVVEEKHSFVEEQVKSILYGNRNAPLITGKTDGAGQNLLPSSGELRPSRIAPILVQRLGPYVPDLLEQLNSKLAAIVPPPGSGQSPSEIRRIPYFCSGCPHSSSTLIPEGAKAFAGIGCHFMASWMDRNTGGLTQMGGEGANWVGQAPFSLRTHVFQNIGDGTFFHSGSLALRQAVAAGTTLTYKILFNDAVAMTGGQPHDGNLTVDQITRLVHAEGVRRIAVVTDDPDKYPRTLNFAPGVTIHHRRDINQVQRELATHRGVSVLVYDQMCAAEKRRKRKRGLLADPPRRLMINEAVCEGCGDCGMQSNCLSLQPVETPAGRKRQIDQSSCNKDFLCVDGFCPSFVSIRSAELRKPKGVDDTPDLAARLANLPIPHRPSVLEKPWEILVTGVGGTGVVTIGALLCMAAHLEGKGASVLDFMGFAQKGGSVLSHVRIASIPDALNQARIDREQADVLLACDMVVATSPDSLGTLCPGYSQVICNTLEIQTGSFTRDPDFSVQGDRLLSILEACVGADHVQRLNAGQLATALTGDSIMANIFLLGFAVQKGLVPVSLEALDRAIALNGVAIDANRRALAWGRLAAVDPDYVQSMANRGREPQQDTDDLDTVIANATRHLTDWQNEQWAEEYCSFVKQVEEKEARISGKRDLTLATARNLAKLMSYKDEYEVARLYTDHTFRERIRQTFGDSARVSVHLAPPLLVWLKRPDSKPRKYEFGPWIFAVFNILARLKMLRGSWLDPFGYTKERRTERSLISEYRHHIREVCTSLHPDALHLAVKIASVPEQIRGFGHIKEKSIEKAREQWRSLIWKIRETDQGR
ncbi:MULTISPECIES: indolepyruvate ferredoxin oxidoreductase family protein [unclassified Haematospirillum]|uniref:indolepyruvate ferredoxin oxidoreductase family protein n=1 Tax=unclassified Haematospirillum TaxID=2622088 RepID=UPI001439FB0B|nr:MULTISPECIES: indolepyruvate ferredoxin oxidoreductase family protein [unclassified Haematospirillum]NKD54202.1 indolepyruvate ferredoxin oxidoreductase family protein [Haematospirillum sp. H4890]NKD74247.1 indolepyruvate ferredoxin oxidoreductase family protein [Haematospirillum sp. H4485]